MIEELIEARAVGVTVSLDGTGDEDRGHSLSLASGEGRHKRLKLVLTEEAFSHGNRTLSEPRGTSMDHTDRHSQCLELVPDLLEGVPRLCRQLHS